MTYLVDCPACEGMLGRSESPRPTVTVLEKLIVLGAGSICICVFSTIHTQTHKSAQRALPASSLTSQK